MPVLVFAYLMRLIMPLTLRRCCVIALPRDLRAVRFLLAIDFLLTNPAFEAARGLLTEIRMVCPFFPPIFRLKLVVLRPFRALRALRGAPRVEPRGFPPAFTHALCEENPIFFQFVAPDLGLHFLIKFPLAIVCYLLLVGYLITGVSPI